MNKELRISCHIPLLLVSHQCEYTIIQSNTGLLVSGRPLLKEARSISLQEKGLEL